MATEPQGTVGPAIKRRIWQALTPLCPSMIASVNIPPKDGNRGVNRVEEMDRQGRFIIDLGSLHAEERCKALERFVAEKPHLLKELAKGVDMDPKLGNIGKFGAKKSDVDEVHNLKLVIAEKTEILSKVARDNEDKESRIAALEAEIAELKKRR